MLLQAQCCAREPIYQPSGERTKGQCHPLEGGHRPARLFDPGGKLPKMSAMLTLLVIAGAARGGSSGRPALNALARSSRKVPFADMSNARGSFTGSVTADNAASESLIEEALCDSVREPLARFSGFLDHGDGRHPIEYLASRQAMFWAPGSPNAAISRDQSAQASDSPSTIQTKPRL